MNIIRALVLCVGLAGGLLFAGAYAASWTSEHFVSATAHEVIRQQVAQDMNEKVDAIGSDFLLSKATDLFGRNRQEIDLLKARLKEGLDERVARITAEMGDHDCGCRAWVSKTLRDGLMSRIGDLDQLQQRLGELIRAKYLETEARLTREFRIFTGTHALVSILLVTAMLVRRKARLQLLPAASVLFLASVVTGYAYLFNQDWLQTMLFGDYVGFAYVGYLGFVFVLLGDILLNRARMTSATVNGVSGLFGKTLDLSPC